MGKVSEAHKISEISFESVKKINELIDELSYIVIYILLKFFVNYIALLLYIAKKTFLDDL